jgi:hypothetical protein
VHVESQPGGKDSVKLPFDDMQRFVDDLRQQIMSLRLSNQGYDGEQEDSDEDVQSPEVEEATETLDTSPRLHRKSLIGAATPLIDAGSLSPALERPKEQLDPKAEGFE